jgi:GNAT superfamily N-acetyltransferase
MTKFAIKTPKLIGRLLFFDPIKGCSIASPLRLPFGSITRLDGHRLTLDVGDGVTRLFALPEKKGLPVINILPPLRWREKLTVAGIGRVEFEGWQVISDVDRMHAMAIILRSHYLNIPSRGLILGCRFAKVQDQERVRRLFKRADRKDAWSTAWGQKAGGMVACAVLDSLYHGKPGGRKELAAREGFDHLVAHWDETSRADIVKTLRVAWASRFAVDAPYRKIGLGTLLAKKLLHVARFNRLPSADFLEVITTHAAKPGAHQDPEHDFLVKAGYIRLAREWPSRAQLVIDKSTGDRHDYVRAKKFYYYAKLTDGNFKGN